MTNQESEHPISLDELYRTVILDHYRNPRNKSELEDSNIAAQGLNPSCGDEIRIAVKIEDGRFTSVHFTGQGCSISQSSASMLTEQANGQKVENAQVLAKEVQRMLTNENFNVDTVDLGDLESLHGVARFPVRIKCALLAWKVLEQIMAEAGGEKVELDSDIQTQIASAS